MYIDLLDSTKSGHPLATDTKEEWWRAKDKTKQLEAVSVAQAAVMMRLLYGDTIVLSNNQALDSYAWLSACQNFVNARNQLNYLPVTWAAYNIANATPDDFIQTAIKTFRPKKMDAKQFKLSAWPGIDDELRERIAGNLETHRSFQYMFKDISIDSSLKPVFEEQQQALINFQTYLQKNFNGSVEWTLDTPTAIKRSNNPSRSIWTDLCSTRDIQPLGIPGEVLDEIKGKIEKDEKGHHHPENLENRSALYSAISDLLDDDLRSRIRQLVDIYYNKKISASVNDGAGLYSIMDQDPDTPVSKDEKMIDFSCGVPQDDSHEKEILYFLPGEFPELSTLKLDDCIRILTQPEIQGSIMSMRNLMLSYPNEPKESPGGLYKHWDWRKQMADALHKHQSLLAEELPQNVKIKNGVLTAYIPNTVLAFAISGAFHGIVSYLGIELPLGMTIVGIGAATGYIAPIIVDKINPLKIPTSVAARIHRKLGNAVIQNYQ